MMVGSLRRQPEAAGQHRCARSEARPGGARTKQARTGIAKAWGDEKLVRQRLVIPANSVARIVRPEAQSDFDSLEPRTEGKRTTQQSR